LKVVVGLCGSIAAYKTLELIRVLRKTGAEVKVILTKSALSFVTPLTCQTLTGQEVHVDQFALTKGIKHLTLSEWADILVIAPATANIIGKAASGIGDDLLSTTLLSFQKPILFVPAMDTGMWQNTIVQRNVRMLRDSGYYFLDPVSGPLASGKIGKGRFPEIQYVFHAILAVLKNRPLLAHRKILISGGRTEEDIDTVRVLTNRSSGGMALELFYAARSRGANVRAVIGETSVAIPQDECITRVRTSSEMMGVLKENFQWCDCLIMAAAVGDYRPVEKRVGKAHENGFSIQLCKTDDIISALAGQSSGQYLIGFSLENDEARERAQQKLASKKLDMIVLNTTQALGSDRARIAFLFKDNRLVELDDTTKTDIAHTILDAYYANTSQGAEPERA
jgi:phosphopantothenoylcysteine decarboxylase/phosphopantothenate--cysteine ligase